MSNLIDRQAAIDAIADYLSYTTYTSAISFLNTAALILAKVPSVQPEPISDAYMKAVWTWLLNYQIKTAELKGRYTPYEVLSWVANDWRKEHV